MLYKQYILISLNTSFTVFTLFFIKKKFVPRGIKKPSMFTVTESRGVDLIPSQRPISASLFQPKTLMWLKFNQAFFQPLSHVIISSNEIKRNCFWIQFLCIIELLFARLNQKNSFYIQLQYHGSWKPQYEDEFPVGGVRTQNIITTHIAKRAKVMFSQVPPPISHLPPSGIHLPHQASTLPKRGIHPPGNTVNVRVVRILVECILVVFILLLYANRPICIKNQNENNNILGADTSDLRFGGVQIRETRPGTNGLFRHTVLAHLMACFYTDH